MKCVCVNEDGKARELLKAEEDILGRETNKISRQEGAWQVLRNSYSLGYKSGAVYGD